MTKGNRPTSPIKSNNKDPGAQKSGPVKKKRRLRPGTRALRNVVKQQRSTVTLLQRGPFYRVIRNIANDVSSDMEMTTKALGGTPIAFCWRKNALEAVQAMVEAEMTNLFKMAVNNMAHAGRTGVDEKDINLYLSTLSANDALLPQGAGGYKRGEEET